MKKLLSSFFAEFTQQTGKILLTLFVVGTSTWVFYILPKNTANYLFETNTSGFLRVLWFVVIVPLFVAFVWLISSKAAIETGWIRANIPSYALIGSSLFEISGVLFSSIVYLMEKAGWVTITPIDGRHTKTIDSMIDLFMWQLLDAIPSLHVTELLHFDKPFSFDGKVGALVLIFEISVIVPIIRFNKRISDYKKEKEEEAKKLKAKTPNSIEERTLEKGLAIPNPDVVVAVNRTEEKEISD